MDKLYPFSCFLTFLYDLEEEGTFLLRSDDPLYTARRAKRAGGYLGLFIHSYRQKTGQKDLPR